MFDAIVIGGGPAGSAAAIRLARTGRHVTLYEKAQFPRAKLCGGFLSPESVSDLEDLHVLPELKRCGFPQIHRTVVVSQSGTKIESALAEPAYSVSRDLFDHLLLMQAIRENVQVVWGQDGFTHTQEADTTVIAAGRLHRSSLSLEAAPLSPWYAGSRVRYVGLQANFQDVLGITDQVELDIVPSGYVGLARQQSGVTICALTTEATVQTYGSDLDQLLKHLISANMALRDHLAGAKRLGSWTSVGPVRLGIRKLAEDRTFYVGDAACVMDPFAGEGMAMGLYASRLLVMALNSKNENPAMAYNTLWRRAYMPALRWNAVMRLLYSIPLLREPLLKGLQGFPQGMNLLTDLTRYRPITA